MIIIGAGGHCRAIISILRDNGWEEPKGILDIDNNKNTNEKILGISILGGIDLLEGMVNSGVSSVLLAIGNNSKREIWFNKALALGCKLPNLISKHAILDITSTLGDGVVACPFAFIGPETKIGNNVLLNTSAIVEHEAYVGEHSHVAPGAIIAGRAGIDAHGFLGANSVIIETINVVENTRIGSGAVVIEDIKEPNGTWVGVPARRVSS